MTTLKAPPPKPKTRSPYRLPDPPERNPDEVTAFDHIYEHGNNHNLAMHFGNPDTTLVVADRWIVATPDSNRSRARRPDLLIAFNVSPALYRINRGYIVSEQGKPPDFVLEVASESTGEMDTGPKRVDYANLGIPEYWRFDETGDYHRTKLAGDWLVAGRYQPISIQQLAPEVFQGYSRVLDLYLRWDHGRLGWYDPSTGQPIATFQSERAGRLIERAARLQAEARAEELAAELRRLHGE